MNKNILKYISFSCKVIIFLAIIFPIGLSFFVTIKHGIPLSWNNHWKGVTTIFLVIIILLTFICKYLEKIKRKKFKKYFYPFFIFSVAFLLRFLSNTIIGNNYNQVSDFQIGFLSGINKSYQNSFYADCSHWALYPQLIYFISFITKTKSVISIQIFNSIIASFSSVFIYFINKNITKNRSAGFLSGLLFAIYLPNVFYINILTPEHPAIFLILLGFLIYILGKSQEKIKKKIPLYLLSTLILATGSFFRPFSHILIFAILMFELIGILFKKNIIKRIIPIIILGLSYIIFTNLGYKYLEISIGKKINRSFIVQTAYIGLNTKCKGTWCPEVIKEITDINNNSNSRETANNILIEKIITDLKYNYKLIPKMMYNKIIYSWSGDSSSIGWIIAGGKQTNENLVIDKYLISIITPVLTINYVLVLIICFISSIKSILKKNLIRNKHLIVYIFLIGTYIIFLFTESQPRYKSVIMPFFFLIMFQKNKILKKKITKVKF